MLIPAPRKRSKPAPRNTPMGLPVIGGPARPAKLAPECTFPTGNFICTDGKPIKVWPYVANSEMIGLLMRERSKKGTIFHMYRLMDNSWRYAGKALDKDEAVRRIKTMHERAVESSLQTKPVMQLVAPPPRRRRIVPGASGVA